MNSGIATAAQWKVSTRADGEVLTAAAGRDGLDFVAAGFPDRFTPEEISGWLNDLVSVTRETSSGDTAARAIPPVLHHALTGLLFSHAELWETDAVSRPCSAVFVVTEGDVAFGWVGEALVEVWVDDGPLEAPFTRVRDEGGREGLGVAFEPARRVRVRLSWSALPGAVGAPGATVEAEWPGTAALAAAEGVTIEPVTPARALPPEPRAESPAPVAVAGVDRPASEGAAAEPALAAPRPAVIEPPAMEPPARRRGWLGRMTSVFRRKRSVEPEAPVAPVAGLAPAVPSPPAAEPAWAPAPPPAEVAPVPEAPNDSAMERAPAPIAADEASGEPAPALPETLEPVETEPLVPSGADADQGPAAPHAVTMLIPPTPEEHEALGEPAIERLAPEWDEELLFRETPAPPALGRAPEAGEDPHARVLGPPPGAREDLEPGERSSSGPPRLRVTPPAHPAGDRGASVVRIPRLPEGKVGGVAMRPVVAPPAAPRESTPRESAPSDAAPRDAAPRDAAPSDAAPGDTTPRDGAPRGVAPPSGEPVRTPAIDAGAATGPVEGRASGSMSAEEAALAAALAALAAETEAALSAREAEPELAPSPIEPATVEPPIEPPAIEVPSVPPLAASPTLEAVDAMRAALDAARDAARAAASGRSATATGAARATPIESLAGEPVAEPSAIPHPDAEEPEAPALDAEPEGAASPAHAERVPLHPEWPSPEELAAPTPLWKKWWAWGVLVLALFLGGWIAGQVDQDPNARRPGPLAALARGIGLGGARYDVMVNSRPPGAWIAVDGKDLARRTPATIELKPGQHAITLSISELGGATFPVRGQRGEQVALDAPLWGSVEVYASESTVPVSVTFDGRDLGYAPVRIDSVMPGPHDLRFSGPGMPSWGQTLEVRVGQQAQVVARPMTSPATGIIEVRAHITDDDGARDLEGASVRLDGAPRGATPLSLELPRGPHSLRVAYRDEVAPVQVIDLPGGNQRFATFEFGLGPDRPQLVASGAPDRVEPGASTVISATLRGVGAADVREMWLHVCTPEGAWRRYQMDMLKSSGADAVGVSVFPVDLFAAGSRARWYASASVATGDEYFTELATLEFAPAAAR